MLAACGGHQAQTEPKNELHSAAAPVSPSVTEAGAAPDDAGPIAGGVPALRHALEGLNRPEAIRLLREEQALRGVLAGMTQEEKVGQLFFVRCPAQNVSQKITAWHLGGVLLFTRDYKTAGEEWLSADAFTKKLADYQAAAIGDSGIPLFIGSDEEGGTVTRASRNPNLFAKRFPSPQQLLRSGGMDTLLAETTAFNERLLAYGVNVNFAPVCDVSVDANDFIHARSFGQDAAATADYISRVTAAMNGTGIGCVLKHFPGYGNNVDTHTGIAIDSRPYTQFETEDLLPFRAGIDAGAPFVLVSHNVIECMDGSLPASLSPAVHETLRSLGFSGIALTDDLAMDAVAAYAKNGSAAVLAVLAGNDMIVTTDFETQIPQVLAAVKNGTIPEETLDAACLRILRVKLQLGLLEV